MIAFLSLGVFMKHLKLKRHKELKKIFMSLRLYVTSFERFLIPNDFKIVRDNFKLFVTL